MAIVTNQPQVIRVTVPGPQGPSAGAAAAAITAAVFLGKFSNKNQSFSRPTVFYSVFLLL